MRRPCSASAGISVPCRHAVTRARCARDDLADALDRLLRGRARPCRACRRRRRPSRAGPTTRTMKNSSRLVDQIAQNFSRSSSGVASSSASCSTRSLKSSQESSRLAKSSGRTSVWVTRSVTTPERYPPDVKPARPRTTPSRSPPAPSCSGRPSSSEAAAEQRDAGRQQPGLLRAQARGGPGEDGGGAAADGERDLGRRRLQGPRAPGARSSPGPRPRPSASSSRRQRGGPFGAADPTVPTAISVDPPPTSTTATAPV